MKSRLRGVGHEPCRDRGEVGSVSSLRLEAGAKRRVAKGCRHPRNDPAADVDATHGTEGERHVASERTQPGEKAVQRLETGRVAVFESAARDVDAALLDDLDVPRALAVAEEAGGEAARTALSVLGLA